MKAKKQDFEDFSIKILRKLQKNQLKQFTEDTC